ncbi:hypothetical protein CBP21_21690 [Fischerella thermalis WC246]|nr:hypothetical protein CBP30_17525 [Fischerella thermalis WC157]PLZ46484.1 hypothetical protein CBP15_22080 [Fischerella thermalis WC442]PLZ59801.1 hypothetical protein CBP24_05880 [Fischerella thermalis WC439]PLZ65426.1 hypothetical protein CBP21_21690 [Fischerella thermalis WC246]PLZ70294.1 hypothetical protein CBP22_07075 [Fischerella thermalis WC249]PLZ77725.1 hypothetical protein CBP14_04680 [Fischerella thermalis WC245]RDH49997.1 hypothetical protein CA946_08735 [Fischerella thermalis 
MDNFFNLIKFYPLAFLITHQLASYEGLSSLHQFNQLLPIRQAFADAGHSPLTFFVGAAIERRMAGEIWN